MPAPILIGHDPHSSDSAPLEFGIAVAAATGAQLILAAVHGHRKHGDLADALVDDDLGDHAPDALERQERELRERGIDLEVRALPGTSVPRTLHEAAAELGAGLLVLGSTRRGRAGRVLPGSTAERLIHGAPCPLAVVPHDWRPGGGIREMGVAYVDTDEGREALAGAVAVARRAGAHLRVLSAAKPHGFGRTFGGGDPLTPATTYEEIASSVRVALEHVVESATQDLPIAVENDVSVGDPAEFLIAASQRLDLLVCGSRGYGPMHAVLLGGVSRQVTAHAGCPVIVLPRGAGAALEALVADRAGTAG